MMGKRASTAIVAVIVVLSTSTISAGAVEASTARLPGFAAPSPVTALALDAEVGAFSGEPGAAVFRPPESQFSLIGEPGRLAALVLPPKTKSDSDLEDDVPWVLEFRAPRGQALATGTYEETNGQPTTAGPMLRISSDPYCDGSVKGRFVVNEYERDADGSVLAVSVSFAQTCIDWDDGSEGTLFGELRFKAAIGFAWHGYPLYLPLGDSIVGTPGVTQTVSITSTGTEPLMPHDIRVATGAGGRLEIVSDRCSGATITAGDSCVVTVRATPDRPGTVYGRLEFADNTLPTKATIGLSGAGIWPASAIAWQTGRQLPVPGASSIARSGVGTGTGYLQSVSTADTGHAGASAVVHRRSSTGATWTKATRISPSSPGVGGARVAASGSAVYVVWGVQSPANQDVNVIYVRANLHQGTGTWLPVLQLTALNRRVSGWSIAAAEDSVYVAYREDTTTSHNEVVSSIKVAISADRGATWRTTTLATAASNYQSWPSVAAAGRMVVVAWRATNYGAVKARLSAKAGDTWANVVTLAAADADGNCGNNRCSSQAYAAAAPDRAVVAWDEYSGTFARVWRSGKWSSDRPVGGNGYLTAVAVSGTNGIAVANNSGSPSWTESRDQGATWIGPSLLAEGDSYSVTSILWPAPMLRYALLSYYEQGSDEDISFTVLSAGRGDP